MNLLVGHQLLSIGAIDDALSCMFGALKGAALLRYKEGMNQAIWGAASAFAMRGDVVHCKIYIDAGVDFAKREALDNIDDLLNRGKTLLALASTAASGLGRTRDQRHGDNGQDEAFASSCDGGGK